MPWSNPGTPYAALAYKELEAAAHVAKVELRAFEVRSPGLAGLELRCDLLAGAGGLAILEDPLTLSQRTESAAVAFRLHVPAIYGYRELQFDQTNNSYVFPGIGLGALMAAGPVLAQGMGGTGTAGGTQNTGPQGTGNFVSGKPGDPGAPTTGRSGTNTGGAGGAASSTSSGDMGNTNNSKK